MIDRKHLTKLWEIKQKMRGCLYKERVESKVKVYLWVNNEVANWFGVPLTPFVEVWTDERDGNGLRLYERVDLRELVEHDRLEFQDVTVRRES
jgi:hypothetical protein